MIRKKTPLEYALYLVQLRDRTENEMRKKMAQKGIDSTEIEKTIVWLKDNHFLDDERFVENFVRSKTNDERTGKRKIEQKLYQLGIAKELIEKNLSSTDSNLEFEKAKELAEKWLKKQQGRYSSSPEGDPLGRGEKFGSSRKASNNSYQRLGQYLAGRGFEIDVIKEVLREIFNK